MSTFIVQSGLRTALKYRFRGSMFYSKWPSHSGRTVSRRAYCSGVPGAASKSRSLLLLVTSFCGGAGVSIAAYYALKPSASAAAPLTPTRVFGSASLPAFAPYLIVGGGAAAQAAARAIRANDPTAKVLILSKEHELPYKRPPLSKDLWSADYSDVQDLKWKTPSGRQLDVFFQHNQFWVAPLQLDSAPYGGVAISLGEEVVEIDPKQKVVKVADGTWVQYDKCLIATGSRPVTFPVLEAASKSSDCGSRMHLFRSLRDFRDIYALVHEYAVKCTTSGTTRQHPLTFCIVGGGFLGPELAVSIKSKSAHAKVHLVTRGDGILSRVLPQKLSDWLVADLQKAESIDIHLQDEVTAISWDASVGQLRLDLKSGKTLHCHHVIGAVGAAPNVAAGLRAALPVDEKHGGFMANERLEVAPDVYAAGDCVSFVDPRTGRRQRTEHLDHATATGRLAGQNMACSRLRARAATTDAATVEAVQRDCPLASYDMPSMFWGDVSDRIGFEAVGDVHSALHTVTVVEPQKQPADLGQSRAVVFYLDQNKSVTGILTWNIFGQVPACRKILRTPELRSFQLYDQLAARIFYPKRAKSPPTDDSSTETTSSSTKQQNEVDAK